MACSRANPAIAGPSERHTVVRCRARRPACRYDACRMGAPRGRLAGLLALVVAVLGGLAACQRRPATPPARGWNLLLVTLDTLRADHLGAYGYAGAETPALDALAARRRALRSGAECGAAHPAGPRHPALSGLLPPRHGLHDNGLGALPPDVETLATRVTAAGYRTGAFVGAFVLDHRFGLARGFERLRRRDRPRHGAIGRNVRARGRAAGARGGRPRAGLAGGDDRAPSSPGSTSTTPTPPTSRRSRSASRHPGEPYDGEIAAVDAQVGRLVGFLARRGDLAARRWWRWWATTASRWASTAS